MLGSYFSYSRLDIIISRHSEMIHNVEMIGLINLTTGIIFQVFSGHHNAYYGRVFAQIAILKNT